MKWWIDIPPLADGVYHGLLIHRHVAPREWPAELERVPAALRPDAEAYLRGIAARMRVARSANHD